MDDLGNAYITGVTQSTLDFPTQNAYQPIYGGERGDAFVTKLNAAGNALSIQHTSAATAKKISLMGLGRLAIAVDSTYNAFVTGYTCSANFPTLGSFQKYVSGCYAFITRLNAVGSALVFSTLLGPGAAVIMMRGNDIALDTQHNVYVVGQTGTQTFSR